MGNNDTRTKNSSWVELTIAHSPLAFIYRLFVPTVTINGTKERRPWGIHTIELSPGDYDISVSYPWILSKECGKNSVHISLGAGDTRKVKYRAGFIRYLPGTITVT
jgi:hypothetical protein